MPIWIFWPNEDKIKKQELFRNYFKSFVNIQMGSLNSFSFLYDTLAIKYIENRKVSQFIWQVDTLSYIWFLFSILWSIDRV